MKSNKRVDRPRATLSDQEDSEKIEIDNGPRATPCDPETSKKHDKTDYRYLFDVTFDDLTRFKEGECPANTEKTPSGRLKFLNHGDRLEIKGIQKNSVLLMYFPKLKVRSCVTGCANT